MLSAITNLKKTPVVLAIVAGLVIIANVVVKTTIAVAVAMVLASCMCTVETHPHQDQPDASTPPSQCCDKSESGTRCGEDIDGDGIVDGICRGVGEERICWYGCADPVYACYATESLGPNCSAPCVPACYLAQP